jgi:TatD-related deoxyribonuclease
MRKYPAFDNHVHLQRKGRYLDAAREFVRKSGTGFMLVNLPQDGAPYNIDYFRNMYDEAIKIREDVSSHIQADVLLAIGPYPVTLVDMASSMGLQKAEELMKEAVHLAIEYIVEGKADALGEVGRPHFNVAQDIMDASNGIMELCFSEASKAGCAVIIHSEEATPENMKEISEMCRRSGMDPGRVIRHHCTPLVREEENYGLMPSVKATREYINASLSKGDRFLMETDYLDDMNRPGAVLGIGTVPRRVKEMVEKGVSEESIWKINSEFPSSIYRKELRFSV